MNYFTPADLKQLDATYNYTARAGLGFAISASNEQVFISARDVERLKLDVGDAIRVWATDNYASPHTAHYPSRWRAVRVEIVSRVADVVSSMPNTAPVHTPATADDLSMLLGAWGGEDKVDPAPAPAPAPIAPSADFIEVFDTFLKEDRPWTVKQLTDAITALKSPKFTHGDLAQRVSNRLYRQHQTGAIAALKVYARGDQKSASAVYYAENVDVLYDHLDAPLGDEE
jgi:hypothetical protein